MDKTLLDLMTIAYEENNDEVLLFSDLLAVNLLEENKIKIILNGKEKSVIIPEGRITYVPSEFEQTPHLIEVLVARLKYINNEGEKNDGNSK